MQVSPPDERTAHRYLLWLSGERLYHEPEAMPEVSSPELFGDGKPLELEAGCGSGDFLCSLARNDPEANFAGVDLHAKSLYKAVKTAASGELENVKFVRADFRLLYPRIPPDSLRAVYLHFPDPGMKPRHQKRRLFSQQFVDEVHRSLHPGGRLSVLTDHEGYFTEMLSLIADDERWERAREERTPDGEARSRFQRSWEEKGRTTYGFELVKRGGVGS